MLSRAGLSLPWGGTCSLSMLTRCMCHTTDAAESTAKSGNESAKESAKSGNENIQKVLELSLEELKTGSPTQRFKKLRTLARTKTISQKQFQDFTADILASPHSFQVYFLFFTRFPARHFQSHRISQIPCV